MDMAGSAYSQLPFRIEEFGRWPDGTAQSLSAPAPAPAATLPAGKREYGLLGGAWDPQDGGHPEADPACLIRTAERTFKAATGVDLSACTTW